MNELLATLKLVAKFGDKKSTNHFKGHVQVKQDDINNDSYTFFATTGRIAIKAEYADVNDPNIHFIKDAITIESIERASKVNCFDLLAYETDITFPNINRVFTKEQGYELQVSMFDSKYMSLIFSAIEAFRKDLKMTICKVKMLPLKNDDANIMQFVVKEGLRQQVRITIAIMPLK